MRDPRSRALWIFGYGSIIWRPAFPYEEARQGFVLGWARRFWQWSTDHRGLPGAPGRVVTVVPAREARCWGMAFRIAPGDEEEVLSRLMARESGGYVARSVDVRGRRAATLRALMFVAEQDNPNFAGPAPIDEIAGTIATAAGPSGPNSEYLLRLDESLREMRAEDEHVTALARRVRQLATEQHDGAHRLVPPVAVGASGR